MFLYFYVSRYCALLLPFQSRYIFFLFLAYYLAWISNTMLSKSGKNEHPCLVPMYFSSLALPINTIFLLQMGIPFLIRRGVSLYFIFFYFFCLCILKNYIYQNINSGEAMGNICILYIPYFYILYFYIQTHWLFP